MAVFFHHIDIRGVKVSRNRVKRWLDVVARSENRTIGDLSIAFCSDDYVVEQNVKYLQHDYPTDIITWSYSESDSDIVEGDLLISTETVASNAKIFGITFDRELHRVIVHGLLHIIGYDDQTDLQREIMRERENFYLNKLDEI